jgi:hypothetical protein
VARCQVVCSGAGAAGSATDASSDAG